MLMGIKEKCIKNKYTGRISSVFNDAILSFIFPYCYFFFFSLWFTFVSLALHTEPGVMCMVDKGSTTEPPLYPCCSSVTQQVQDRMGSFTNNILMIFAKSSPSIYFSTAFPMVISHGISPDTLIPVNKNTMIMS